MRKVLFYVFAIISIATIFEYLFVCGMFTGPFMMALTLCVGGVNAFISFKAHDHPMTVLYIIAAVGICMGYWKLMI